MNGACRDKHQQTHYHGQDNYREERSRAQVVQHCLSKIDKVHAENIIHQFDQHECAIEPLTNEVGGRGCGARKPKDFKRFRINFELKLVVRNANGGRGASG
jgi:hypothetical protein